MHVGLRSGQMPQHGWGYLTGSDLFVAFIIAGGGFAIAGFVVLAVHASARSYVAGPRALRRAVWAARRSRMYHNLDTE